LVRYLQAKQDLFRDSFARHKKLSTAVTATLISAGNVDFDASIAKVVAKLDVCRERIDTCDLSVNAEQLNSKLQVQYF